MPDRLVNIDRVYPHGGTRRGFDQVAVGLLFQYDPDGDVLLFLEGPADTPAEPGALTWDVQAKFVTSKGEKKDATFVRDRDSAGGLFRKFKIPGPAWPPCLDAIPKVPKRFVAAELPTTAVLEFTFTLNTNHKLVAQAGAAAADLYRLRADRGENDSQTQEAKKAATAAILAACPPVMASGFKPQAKESYDYRGADGLGRVKVKPTPLWPLPGYAGYVAIDLGNTGSMLAYMPHKHQGEIGLLRLESRQAGAAAAGPARDAVPTAVWIKGYKPAPAPVGDDAPEMPEADWEIAWDAAGGPNDVLVLGAKRLLSDPSRDRDAQDYRVWLNSREARIPKRLPAELFLTELVRTFHERVDDGPRQIAAPAREEWEGGPAGPTGGMAVTYPTTFSVREIANLRRAAYSGWRRALGEGRYDDTESEMDRVITLLIDEASAAALYFIYRDFLSDSGRARWFRYLYPKGMNVLVYDCGGGTTDIALIRVHAEYRGGDEDSVSQLHIRVVGRTGHRGFGGDDITKAVFALIKAKVAAALPAGKTLNLPAAPAALAAYLEKQTNLDRIEDVFKTRFERTNLFDKDTRDRAAAVLELWREAEWVKTQFTADPAGKVKPGLSGQGGRDVGKYYGERLKMQPAQVDALVNKVEVSRAELDAVIGARVAATVERANGLIRRRLGPDRPGADADDIGADVHKVYLLGNASRYPLIRQWLVENSEVPFLAGGPDPGADSLTRRLVFDEDNLKGAVAKGAVAALRMREAFHGVEVFFDDSLRNRLPYHVSYADVGRGVQVLFRESEQYDALNPTVIPRPDFRDQPAAREGGRTVFLQRQWPDDNRTEPYLTFEFAREIVGDLTVTYEPALGSQPPSFIMSDPESGQDVKGVEVNEAEYVSPPQSGLL